MTAAVRLFQEHGYEGTSVTRIAKAAHMAPANMYWHFPSKQDLLAEVLGTMYRRAFEELAESMPEGDAITRLSHYVRVYVRMQLTELSGHCNFGYASLAAALPTDEQKKLSRIGRPFIELFREILHQGIDDGVFVVDDVKVTAFAISSTCEYVFTWFRSSGPSPIEHVEDQYVLLILRMVGIAQPALEGV